MSIAILKTQANPKDLSPNISLKENEIFFSFSQIGNQRFPTSLNNNIKSNSPSKATKQNQNNKGELNEQT